MAEKIENKTVVEWFEGMTLILPTKVFGEGGLPEDAKATLVGESEFYFIVECNFPSGDGKLRESRIAISKNLLPLIISYTSSKVIEPPRIIKP